MQDAEAPRYEEDFYSWSLDQANRLRQLQERVGNDSQGVDFENVIEEVEDLSGQRNSYRSYSTSHYPHGSHCVHPSR